MMPAWRKQQISAKLLFDLDCDSSSVAAVYRSCIKAERFELRVDFPVCLKK